MASLVTGPPLVRAAATACDSSSSRLRTQLEYKKEDLTKRGFQKRESAKKAHGTSTNKQLVVSRKIETGSKRVVQSTRN